MSVFIAEYWLEIIFGLIAAGALAFCKYLHSKWKKASQYDKDLEKAKILEEAKQEADKEVAQVTQTIELKIDNLDTSLATNLARILYEMETLSAQIEDVSEKEHVLEERLLTSYRFRLIQLCRLYLSQKYLTQDQFDQLTEFFKLYSAMGGNGQGREYYEKAIALPIRDEE